MEKKIKNLQKYYFPLIVIFLFSNVKAEPYGSAFTDLNSFYSSKDDLGVFPKDAIEAKYKKAEALFKSGNLAEALTLALSLLREGDGLILIKSNFLIGKIYERRADVSVGLKYLNEALRLLDSYKIKDINLFVGKIEELEASILLELSVADSKVNKGKEKVSNSFYFLNRLLKIESINEDVLRLKAKAYNNLAVINFNKKEYKEAENLSLKAIKINKEIKKDRNTSDMKTLANIYSSLACVYVVTDRQELALDTYLKALEYVEHTNERKLLELKEVLYYNVAWTMYKLKDYKAYEYFSKSYDLKDSLVDASLRKELKKIEQMHNVDIIRKEEENKRLRLVRNNWFIGGIGLLVSLLFLYLANVYKSKQKQLKLQLSLSKFEQQKKIDDLLLESQSKILNATIDGKEAERKQIAETLHDNVSALLSSANMHLQATQKHFGDNPPVELEKTKFIITEASQKIRDLSHNLVSSILLKFGLSYALKDAAKKYSNSTIKIHTAISDDVCRYFQDFEIKIYNIIQELINNILKHSNATTAYVVMECEDDRLLIIVKDNGVGFEKKSIEQGGIGLNQIEARVRLLNGIFKIESSKNKGTKVILEVPVVKREETKLV